MINYFWKWNKAIPESVCNALFEEIKNLEFKDAEIGKGASGVKNHEVRKNKTSWLTTNHWFEGILYNHARYANYSSGWNYDINHISQVQISSYTKDEFYDWHQDDSLITDSKEQRKLSVVAQLSKAEDFTAGGLEISLNGKFDKKDTRLVLENQGDLIVFPSHLWHKAIPVDSGKRMTAVSWIYGPAFK